MNLGIYVKNLSISDETEMLINNVNKGIEEGLLNSASVFFDVVGFNPLPMKCGCFNSADLWNFRGKLITTTLDATVKSIDVINKFDIFYYYGWEEKCETLQLISATNNNRVKVVCKDKDSEKEFYRLTNKKSYGIINQFDIHDIMELINDK